ncbi:hypothetical protein CDL15_Pgr004524 [Punica granatum]|nr:hypothetical protein CDL15_Pgr004524 [Punica granatum]
METKFCYYNNYNVNQPRHFCKNCQRYWTAGGTMRNVPVGACRRKNKSSSAFSNNNRHAFAIPEALQNARSKILCGVHHSPFEHPGNSGKISAAGLGVMTPQGFPSHDSCFPWAPWPYPWIPPLIPLPTLCSPPTFPTPIYPVAAATAAAAYWGCSAPTNWSTVPGLPQPASPNTSASTNPSSDTNSPTLGKHPREDTMLKRDNFREDDERNDDSSSDQRLWIPKTLRIDDPREAAKSSIWTTLGINMNDNKADSTSRTLFKAFQPKVEEKNRITDPSPVLKANPAALSRSLNFQEST